MLWSAGAVVLCLFICLPFFFRYKQALRYRLAACYKSMGTLCAAALALTAAIRLDPRCWICFSGILLHAAADWFLEFNLYLGGGFFIAGHICYIAFFTNLFPPSALHLICVVCLLAITAFMFWRWRKQIGKQIVFFSVYGAVLSVMRCPLLYQRLNHLCTHALPGGPYCGLGHHDYLLLCAAAVRFFLPSHVIAGEQKGRPQIPLQPSLLIRPELRRLYCQIRIVSTFRPSRF